MLPRTGCALQTAPQMSSRGSVVRGRMVVVGAQGFGTIKNKKGSGGGSKKGHARDSGAPPHPHLDAPMPEAINLPKVDLETTAHAPFVHKESPPLVSDLLSDLVNKESALAPTAPAAPPTPPAAVAAAPPAPRRRGRPPSRAGTASGEATAAAAAASTEHAPAARRGRPPGRKSGAVDATADPSHEVDAATPRRRTRGRSTTVVAADGTPVAMSESKLHAQPKHLLQQALADRGLFDPAVHTTKATLIEALLQDPSPAAPPAPPAAPAAPAAAAAAPPAPPAAHAAPGKPRGGRGADHSGAVRAMAHRLAVHELEEHGLPAKRAQHAAAPAAAMPIAPPSPAAAPRAAGKVRGGEAFGGEEELGLDEQMPEDLLPSEGSLEEVTAQIHATRGLEDDAVPPPPPMLPSDAPPAVAALATAAAALAAAAAPAAVTSGKQENVKGQGSGLSAVRTDAVPQGSMLVVDEAPDTALDAFDHASAVFDRPPAGAPPAEQQQQGVLAVGGLGLLGAVAYFAYVISHGGAVPPLQ